MQSIKLCVKGEVYNDIIANKHNGELLVESLEGIGSKFTIKLPLS